LKRLLLVKRRTIDTNAGKFWIDPVSILGMTLMRDGTYEPGMRSILGTFLGPGKVFVDLGANEGYFTVLGARLTRPEGRVIAIEPQDRLIPIISTNLRQNDLSATIVKTAVSDRRVTTVLHLAPSTNPGSSGLHRATKYPVPKQPVRTVTLADVLDDNQVGVVDLLKVDIEGFEFEAILGSPHLFTEKRIKAMALELHPAALTARGKSVEELGSFLAGAGYSATTIGGHTVWTAETDH
jgi:FkbM family methyltransferase